ncbi:MAG TPA: hypothetical protein VMX97_13100 [Hyphomicrobiaceae bacterium]|nr:hypothetical protein [Hyphomicrobiaceae bacterium]
MDIDLWSLAAKHSSEVIAGIVGGAVTATLTGLGRYVYGWHQASRQQGAHFHIAGTMYTPLDPANPAHAPALEAGKSHVQELLWLGDEIGLPHFVPNPYMLRTVSSAMARTSGAGLLLGHLPQRVETPLLKKILGHHNTIPATGLINAYKTNIGTAPDGRVHGISPPVYEHYKGSDHRRVLRAMFIAESQLMQGIPPREKVHFPHQNHVNRHATLSTLIAGYHENPQAFDCCRAYF